MNLSSSRSVALLYGTTVIVSGLFRYFGEPNGQTGLWFGIVLGSLALAAGFLFHVRQNIVASILIWVSIVVVGGWFFYEACIKKGVFEAEIRLVIMVLISVTVAIFYFRALVASKKTNVVVSENTNN